MDTLHLPVGSIDFQRALTELSGGASLDGLTADHVAKLLKDLANLTRFQAWCIDGYLSILLAAFSEKPSVVIAALQTKSAAADFKTSDVKLSSLYPSVHRTLASLFSNVLEACTPVERDCVLAAFK